MSHLTRPTLLTTQDVARHLGVPLVTLTWWIWALREDKRYRQFSIARAGGGPPRHISAPIKPIKDLQRNLAATLTSLYEPLAHVHGFVPARSPLTNATFHRHKRWVLRVDLADFFPSINFGRVRGMFMAHPFEYPTDVATLLAQLCCFRNELPQGAPTSPAISNLICRGLDKHLAQLARTHHCHYTRYADDLCFSNDRVSFPAALASRNGGVVVIGPALEAAINQAGFQVNPAKTRLMARTQRQRVTGLIVNEDINVPREYTRSLRNVLHIWRRYGEVDAAAAFARVHPHLNWPPGKLPPEFRLVIRGRVQHVGSVRGYHDDVYRRLASSLARVDETFAPPPPARPLRQDTVRYLTEGPTDVLHIDAASRYFLSRQEFLDLKLEADPDYKPSNDKRLLDRLSALATTAQPTPCVGVFDSDSSLATKLIGQVGRVNLGNGVVAITLAAPPWRRDDEPLCIEMLYPDAVLKRTDSRGRRVFLREEFGPTGAYLGGEPYFTPLPKRETLVREEVYEAAAEREASVALSKMAFARAIGGADPPYENVDCEGFRPTFERLQRAVREAWTDISKRSV